MPPPWHVTELGRARLLQQKNMAQRSTKVAKESDSRTHHIASFNPRKGVVPFRVKPKTLSLPRAHKAETTAHRR